MTKLELSEVIYKKVKEKSLDVERNYARFKETENPKFLQKCTEAKGFNDGVEWLIEKLSEVDDI